MNKDVIIETERLILRQWNMDDINDVVEGLNTFKDKAKKEIEKLTAMNVVVLEVVAKSLFIPEKREEN